MIESLEGKAVTLIGGDGRCDSPWHSAKYGTYTLIDPDTEKIVDTTVIAVPEVSTRFFLINVLRTT